MAYPDDELVVLCESLLVCGAAALTAAGQDVPARTFISASQPPAEPTECAETLAAWPGPLRTVPVPPQQKRGCTSKTVAELHLTLYRCVPTMQEDGTPPTPATLDASGRSLAVDGWVLWRAILKGWTAGTLFEDVGCQAVDLSRGEINLPPLGGLAGWDTTVLLTL